MAVAQSIAAAPGSFQLKLDAAFTHNSVNHPAKQFVDGMALTNGIESVRAVLKRGFYGTYHSFSEKHIPLYVHEFVFRLNERNCAIDTVDRLNSLIQGMNWQRLTYEMLTKGKAIAWQTKFDCTSKTIYNNSFKHPVSISLIPSKNL
jgi:hypothetical protein